MTRQTSAFRLVASLAIACFTCNSTWTQEITNDLAESLEPPLKYVLRIDSQSIEISEGNPVRIDGTYSNPEVTIMAEANRQFPYGGISFRYPRAFTFEAEVTDPNYHCWTLSGNDFKIMYFVLAGDMTTAEFAESMSDSFGRDNCKIASAVPTKFGDQHLAGTTLNVTLLGSNLIVDIYRIPTTGDTTKLLVLQDNLDDGGHRSAEGKSSLDLLRQTSKLDQ